MVTRVELTGIEDIPTPADLFNIIGRGAEKRLAPQAESWDALNAMWVRGRAGIKDSGLGVKDRKYVVSSGTSNEDCSSEWGSTS